MGIPTQWSNYLFRLVALLLPLMFLSPTFRRIISRRPCTRRGTGRVRRAKPLLRQGLILLIAYIMFISPEGFYQLSRAYASIDAGDAVFYTYDDNGSLIKKIIAGKDETDPDTNFEEKVTYHYNLANRLETVTTNRGDTVEVVGYIYNDDGIRVESQFTRTVSGITDQTRITTYLVDVYNHTGYAQTLEEETVTTDYIDGVPQTPVTETSTYLIGDDIIAQSTDGNTQYLLYDGHGSTRQLAEYDGSVTIADSYSYDGYGVLLQDDAVAQNNPGKASQQATNLLYAGEHFDTDAQQYYLRARYYNPLNGRFNRIDPFGGNYSDPQSLHKYLYCHANPINNVDPSGDMILFGYNITGVMMGIAITAMAIITTTTIYNGVRHGLEPLSIAWQVIQNLAVFGLIIGVTLLTGPLALAASITLLAAFVAGIIGIVKNWPNMDTTDKVILAVNFICFLAFAGAVRTATMPKPPPASSFQPGACSKLPESYYSKPIVDMRGAPAKSPTNAAGYARNASYFWKQIKNSNPEYFSAENLARIQASKPISPKVDATWIKYHPQHQSYMGKTLVHHHIGQGPYATPLPQTVHYSWTRFFHTNQGKQ